LRDSQFRALRKIARRSWTRADKIIRLAEHFAQMRAGARANIRHNVGAAFAMGLVMAQV
jgi:hypothetical protein